MTAQPTLRPRTRLFGTLGVVLSALLSPSGKIISSAVAGTVLVGGIVTQLPPAPRPAVKAAASTPVAPTYLVDSGSSVPMFTSIEVDGQTLPVVLTMNPTGSNSVAGHERAPASPQPALRRSAGNGQMPHMGSPGTGLRHGASARLSSPDGGLANAPAPDGPGNELPEVFLGNGPGQSEEESYPGSTPLASPNPAGPNDPDEASAPTPTPQQGEPLESFPGPGNMPDLLDLPELQAQPGKDDSLNPQTPTSALPEPLPLSNGDQLPLQIVDVSPDAVPEPTTIALMLLGLLSLTWTGRRAATHTRRHS